MEGLPLYFTGFLAVLMLTSFVKILTVLSILRYGIGLNGIGFGLVIVIVSLALSLFVMSPDVERAGGLDMVLSQQLDANEEPALEATFRPFIEKHVDVNILERLSAIALRLDTTVIPEELEDDRPGDDVPGDNVVETATTPFGVLVAAFIVSELKVAFQIGFIILIPFLVVDLLVTNVLMSLGITQISQHVVSLPLKILLFFIVDGWLLITEKLVSGYL